MVYDICIFLLLFVCRNVVGTQHTYNLIFSISIAFKYEYGKHNEILAIKNTTATTHTPHIMWNEYAAVQPRHNMPWYALQCNAITPHNSTPVSQLAVNSTDLNSRSHASQLRRLQPATNSILHLCTSHYNLLISNTEKRVFGWYVSCTLAIDVPAVYSPHTTCIPTIHRTPIYIHPSMPLTNQPTIQFSEFRFPHMSRNEYGYYTLGYPSIDLYTSRLRWLPACTLQQTPPSSPPQHRYSTLK